MTMNTRLIIPALIAATCAVGGFSTAANADPGAFGWVPVLGPLGDGYIREWRDRTSSESVPNQVFGGFSYSNRPIGVPIYQRPAPPPPPQYGPPQYYGGAYGAYGYAPQYGPPPLRYRAPW